MLPRYALHQMRSGMIAKVRAHISDPETTRTCFQIDRMMVRRLVKHVNLEKNKKIITEQQLQHNMFNQPTRWYQA